MPSKDPSLRRSSSWWDVVRVGGGGSIEISNEHGSRTHGFIGGRTRISYTCIYTYIFYDYVCVYENCS